MCWSCLQQRTLCGVTTILKVRQCQTREEREVRGVVSHAGLLRRTSQTTRRRRLEMAWSCSGCHTQTYIGLSVVLMSEISLFVSVILSLKICRAISVFCGFFFLPNPSWLDRLGLVRRGRGQAAGVAPSLLRTRFLQADELYRSSALINLYL